MAGVRNGYLRSAHGSAMAPGAAPHGSAGTWSSPRVYSSARGARTVARLLMIMLAVALIVPSVVVIASAASGDGRRGPDL